MRFAVEIATCRELIEAGGVPLGVLAKRLGLSVSMASLKMKGLRPLFIDEVGAIVGAVNESGRMTITEEQVIRLVGKSNLKVRGFVG